MTTPSAPRNLPSAPHLRPLKAEAKRRQRAGEFAQLSDALFAIAREHGFSSWPKLKAHVEAARLERTQRLDAFLDASVPRPTADHRGGGLLRARALLDVEPALASATIWCAAVTGDPAATERFLEADPERATAPGGPRDWPPLLYLCFSAFLREEPSREPDFDAVAALLLAAGADPNASFYNPDDPVGTETALYGASGVVRSPILTRRLLEAGASVSDEEVAYHAPAAPECMAVWLSFDPPDDQLTTALLRTLDFEDLDATRRVLEHGADPSAASMWDGRTALHQAIDRWRPLEAISLLLEHGADANRPDAHGQTPYVLAARLGRTKVAERLREAGADTELAPVDRLVAAAARGERAEAMAVLEAHPDVLSAFTERDHRVLAEAAKAGREDAVELMLELGFDRDAGEHGYTPLHWAAFHGHREVVDILLERGADPCRRDPHYRAAAWGWAGAGGHPELRMALLRRAANEGSMVAAVALGDGERVDGLLEDDATAAGQHDGWQTPLAVAAELGHAEVADALLAAGADPNDGGPAGLAPLAMALQHGHDGVAEALRRHGAREPEVPRVEG